ncbi:MAG: CcmH, cytochrome c-type biosis protein CcmH [Dehalococcoidia bacterium]|nr:CcmH, cytochrome c-type biosis protein CcmH [Dehalococcoidia bacterium]
MNASEECGCRARPARKMDGEASVVMVRARGLGPGVLLLFIAILLLVGGCSSTSKALSAYELEEKAQGIDKSLMCPICPGETIDQSQATLAKQMQTIVREKLAQGESREEILQFFVDKYGPSVLAEPPKRGFNLLVWVVPPVALVLGGVILVMVVRGMRRPSHENVPVEEPLAEAELEPYLTRVDREIARLIPPGDRPEKKESDRRAE